jgi:DNA polymerase-3 subunit alpha
MKLADFNDIKESLTLASANKDKNLRIAGLVIDAQHRISRNGKISDR